MDRSPPVEVLDHSTDEPVSEVIEMPDVLSTRPATEDSTSISSLGRRDALLTSREEKSNPSQADS